MGFYWDSPRGRIFVESEVNYGLDQIEVPVEKEDVEELGLESPGAEDQYRSGVQEPYVNSYDTREGVPTDMREAFRPFSLDTFSGAGSMTPMKEDASGKEIKNFLKANYPTVRVSTGRGYIEARIPWEADPTKSSYGGHNLSKSETVFDAGLRNLCLDIIYGKDFNRHEDNPNAGNVRDDRIAMTPSQWDEVLSAPYGSDIRGAGKNLSMAATDKMIGGLQGKIGESEVVSLEEDNGGWSNHATYRMVQEIDNDEFMYKRAEDIVARMKGRSAIAMGNALKRELAGNARIQGVKWTEIAQAYIDDQNSPKAAKEVPYEDLTDYFKQKHPDHEKHTDGITEDNMQEATGNSLYDAIMEKYKPDAIIDAYSPMRELDPEDIEGEDSFWVVYLDTHTMMNIVVFHTDRGEAEEAAEEWKTKKFPGGAPWETVRSIKVRIDSLKEETMEEAAKYIDIGDGFYINRVGLDPNGNYSVWVSRGSNPSRKIQTNRNAPAAHQKDMKQLASDPVAQQELKDYYIDYLIKRTPKEREQHMATKYPKEKPYQPEFEVNQ